MYNLRVNKTASKSTIRAELKQQYIAKPNKITISDGKKQQERTSNLKVEHSLLNKFMRIPHPQKRMASKLWSHLLFVGQSLSELVVHTILNWYVNYQNSQKWGC